MGEGLETTSIVAVHIDLEKAIMFVKNKIENETGETFTKKDISKVIADAILSNGSGIKISVEKSKKRKRNVTTITCNL